ncbi:MAG: hypothetical protein IJS40_09410 [Synergistaceae bacterium]|nr:hypothetical protein [Synergistaceae bacterium]
MFKKFFVSFLFLLLLVSSACAEVELWVSHDSIASITDGHADFSDARFSNLFFTVIHNDTPVTKENAALTGTINLSGGNYSFWDGKKIQKKSPGLHRLSN